MSETPMENAPTENVIILGATGSVGRSALAVIARHPRRYRVAGLAAQADVDAMADLCREFAPPYVALADAGAARKLAARLAAEGLRARVNGGADAVTELAMRAAEIVVCGIAGAVGLRSTVAAVRGGKKVLIANKEPLVMLGAWICREARARGATILPIDSEHNALFQCLPKAKTAAPDAVAGTDLGDRGIRKIILTGSGGPCWRLPAARFGAVTPAQACAHPIWQMGRKISVDSATMMNKGLELIEACALFQLRAEDIDIVIHPQSLVHALVEYADGTMLGAMGAPDMRIPIAHALGWPRRIDSGAPRLNLADCAKVEFFAPDDARFPAIGLARAAAAAGGVVPAVLNAANEEAVRAFLDEKLSFDKIPRVVAEVVERAVAWSAAACDLDNALAADREARQKCRETLARYCN